MASIPAATTAATTGVDITTPATAAALTQTMTNDGKTCLVVKNGNAGTINITAVARQTVVDGNGTTQAVPNRAVAIPTGKTYILGPYSPGVYNDANGEVTFTIDVIATVTLMATRHSPLAA